MKAKAKLRNNRGVCRAPWCSWCHPGHRAEIAKKAAEKRWGKKDEA